jgi:hypothetical protein
LVIYLIPFNTFAIEEEGQNMSDNSLKFIRNVLVSWNIPHGSTDPVEDIKPSTSERSSSDTIALLRIAY